MNNHSFPNDISDFPLAPGERLDEVNEQLRLIQKTEGLTFGTDAYLLAAFIRETPRGRAVELGAGTGIVSLLTVARNKAAHVSAVELQPDYAELCRRNVALNQLCTRIDVISADVRALRATDLGGEADLVFANPPYMRTTSGKPSADPGKNAARHETAGDIADFCMAAARLLKHGRAFYCVYRPDRLADLMVALDRARLAPKRMTFVHSDVDSPPAMVLVESRKGGATGLTVTPPLFLYHSADDRGAPRVMTDKAKQVYDTCALYPKEPPRQRTKQEVLP